MPNSASVSAAGSITGQSESLPMTAPTSGLPLIGSVLPFAQVARRVTGPLAERIDVVAEHGIGQRRDVSYLPPGPDGLAVQVHVAAGIGAHHVRVPRVHVTARAGRLRAGRIVAAEHVG